MHTRDVLWALKVRAACLHLHTHRFKNVSRGVAQCFVTQDEREGQEHGQEGLECISTSHVCIRMGSSVRADKVFSVKFFSTQIHGCV